MNITYSNVSDRQMLHATNLSTAEIQPLPALLSVLPTARSVNAGESFLTSLLIFCVLTLGIKFVLERKNTTSPLPPGPYGLPVFGYLPFVGASAHLTFEKLSEKYGSIFHIYMGRKLFVIVADPKLLRKAFKQEALTGRPKLMFVDAVMEGLGISSAVGDLWKEQRRFAHTVLRDLGFSKSSKNRSQVEDEAMRATAVLVEEMAKSNGQPLDINNLLSFTVVNIFFSVITGMSFKVLDPDIMVHIKGNSESFNDVGNIQIANFFPSLMRLPQFRRKFDNILNRKMALQSVLKTIVKQHLSTLDSAYVRDFVDAYLIKMADVQNTGNPGFFSEEQLLHVLGDLFGAVSETTTTNIKWLFLAMSLHPEIQTKVHEELDSVVGRSRRPDFEDLPRLPYTESVILETLRYATILPVGAIRTALEETELNGYRIPKDTAVLGLFWKFHHDPSLWLNPNEFDPKNFLNDDGTVQKPTHFMPFSTGRRICLGEDIARMLLFLIFTHVMHEFRLQLAPESSDVTMEHTNGFILSPKPYKLIAEIR